MSGIDKKILLMGNPNVGKSVFFSELTGIKAVSSNYAGTTVSYMEGDVKLTIDGAEQTMKLIDVPGTYSLNSTSKAEKVAAEFAKAGADAIICVLDASNLERNLCLALELQQFDIPTVYTLNLSDVAERRGIIINDKLLAQELGAPVIPTIAVKNKGINELKTQLEAVLSKLSTAHASCGGCENCPNRQSHLHKCGAEHGYENIWCTAKLIAKRVTRRDVTRNGKNGAFLDRLGDSMMKPFPGIPIAVLVIAALIGVVVFGGRGLRAGVMLPLVNQVIVPFFRWVFTSFVPEGVFLNILVGEFGIFVISFEWILALIFPYVLLFYIGFSFLEDSGYLPRIGVLFDNIMRKLGVQGGSLIYAMMGFGCAVPAIIGTRAATSRKERIVMSAAICFAIPCVSQTGALISLVSAYSWWMMPALIALGLFLFVTSALIAGKLVKGKADPLVMEVPNLLLPEPKAYGRKLLIRMKHFLMDAEVPMMIAIVLAALLKETGALDAIARAAEPLMSQWLGMPREAVIGLVLGIIRREMSIVPLLELELTSLQAFIGGAVSLMYLPCLSVFAILTKEFKVRVATIIALCTTFTAIFIGGLINQIAQVFI